MHTAFRPSLTAGIAIAGASVIAVAPVTVPPQWPAVDVAAPAAVVRTVTADVELTGLVDDLVNAVYFSVTETVKLYTETLPATLLNLIAQGRFAHIVVLAVNTAYLTPLTIIAPFAVEVLQAIPMPLGTTNGAINEALKIIIQVPAVTGVSILSLFASIIDDGLSPFDALVGSFGYLQQAVATTVESIEKIVAMLAPGVPFAKQAESDAMVRAPQLTSAAEIGSPQVVPVAPDAAKADVSTQAVAVAFDSAATSSAEVSEGDVLTETAGSEDEPTESSDEHAVEGETPNGGTDLSDGNPAAPRGTATDPAGASADGSNTEGSDAHTVDEDTSEDTSTTDTEADHSEAESSE